MWIKIIKELVLRYKKPVEISKVNLVKNTAIPVFLIHEKTHNVTRSEVCFLMNSTNDK